MKEKIDVSRRRDARASNSLPGPRNMRKSTTYYASKLLVHLKYWNSLAGADLARASDPLKSEIRVRREHFVISISLISAFALLQI